MSLNRRTELNQFMNQDLQKSVSISSRLLSLFISMTTANQGTLPKAAQPIIAVHEVQLHMGGSSDSFCWPISSWQLTGNVKVTRWRTNWRRGKAVSALQDPTWPSSVVPRRCTGELEVSENADKWEFLKGISAEYNCFLTGGVPFTSPGL